MTIQRSKLPCLVALLLIAAGDREGACHASEPGKDGKPSKEDVVTNSLGIKLILIPAGEFMMGTPKKEAGRVNDESPQRRVRITKPFYLGVHEVTQEQYQKIMGKNPSMFKGGTRPVDTISWDDAMEFCRKLSAKEGLTYRLPTEAEWEYACRAGTTTKYSFGDDRQKAGEYGWFTNNTQKDWTQPVGQKKPNAWGLHDMHGNVAEWCADWYDRAYYAKAPEADPKGPSTGTIRVLRGGTWNFWPNITRSADRLGSTPDDRYHFYGLRIARTP